MKLDAKHTASLRSYIKLLFDIVQPSLDANLQMQLRNAVEEINAHLTGDRYFNRRKYMEWKKRYATPGTDIVLKIKRYFFTVRKNSPVKALLNSFFRFYNNGERVIDAYNEQFVSRELTECSALFDTIEKYPLDPRQCEAVVYD